jgi:hypothetical protein
VALTYCNLDHRLPWIGHTYIRHCGTGNPRGPCSRILLFRWSLSFVLLTQGQMQVIGETRVNT